MANPYKGEVDIELGGETLTLRYGHNAIAEIENELGSSVGQIFSDEESFGVRHMLVCIAAGLRWRDHRMTAKRVGNLLDKSDHDLAYYGERMGNALKLVLSKKENEIEEGGKDDNENVHPLTGTDS